MKTNLFLLLLSIPVMAFSQGKITKNNIAVNGGAICITVDNPDYPDYPTYHYLYQTRYC
ncbi:MAG: hypothetical protein LBL04_06955 [Bacteroidales bacterium]|nr:hypothetical protein [Bacteroidales bacterium]